MDLSVAQELVEGLQSDLDPGGVRIWERIPPHPLVAVDQAMQWALAEEAGESR